MHAVPIDPSELISRNGTSHGTGTMGVMSPLRIGYARVSTQGQEFTAQRNALTALGVEPERIYVDHGLTGTNRARPGLREALAACRAGDMLVVIKLDRLARSLPDARDIADDLTQRSARAWLGVRAQFSRASSPAPSAGAKSPAELAELLGIGRSTVSNCSSTRPRRDPLTSTCPCTPCTTLVFGLVSAARYRFP